MERSNFIPNRVYFEQRKPDDNSACLGQDEFVQHVLNSLKALSEFIPATHLFSLVRTCGTLHTRCGSEDAIHWATHHNYSPGTPLTMENIGIHAVSIAILTGQPAIVAGYQHSMLLFQGSTSMCRPVFFDDQLIGYLGLSFLTHIDYLFAIPLLEQVVQKIESDLIHSRHQMDTVQNLMGQCKLTKREKEIAVLWFDNLQRYEIAQTLCLSEETVRSHIRNIYAKVGVTSRGEFIKKFSTK